jgi:regulation of enolase protein 1 (concanavalin A-like superfamily)
MVEPKKLCGGNIMKLLQKLCRRRLAWFGPGAIAALVVGGLFTYAEPPAKEAKPDGKEGEGKFKFLAYDGFDGKLGLNWQPVRHDATHVSLTKNPGKLTITTQRGTIHGDEKARGEPLAKNLFVIDNPLAKETDFVVTTCISSFAPFMAYQQAGLICYDDDDNYLKWGWEFDWHKGQGQTLYLVREIDANPEHHYVQAGSGWKKVWLRLSKRGNVYEYSASSDGKDFTVYGAKPWGEGAPKKIGFLAKNGGQEGVPEIDACFEFFELRAAEAAAKGKN